MESHNRVKWFIFTFTLGILLSSSRAQTEDTNQLVVTIPQGTIQGTTMTTRKNRSISAFLGIPYGAPPIGNLRFANPVAAGNWTGIRDGSVDGNICARKKNEVEEGAEDCLNLNVYVPQITNTTNSSLLPTMVYVYGGRFYFGRASSTKMRPVYLLDKDIVFVIMNYRMGPFGFLSTGDEVASGNWGLKDVVLALKWVQENIEYFGGDPDRVTLVGSSSGSSSTHLVALGRGTEGLFQRFITQSGSALAVWGHRPRADYKHLAYELGNHVGCKNDTSTALVDCLRKIKASEIMTYYHNFDLWKEYPIDRWGPTDEPDYEGALLPDTPTNLYAAGHFRDVPWIVGTNRDDGVNEVAKIYESGHLDEFLEKFDTAVPVMLGFSNQADGGVSWLKAIKDYYFNTDFSMEKTVLLKNLTNFITDTQYLYPAYKAVKQHFTLAENPIYFYNFSYRGSFSSSMSDSDSTTDYGVAHSDELSYLFPCRLLWSACANIATSETDYEMIDIMTEMWTTFAANGVPSTLDGTTWNKFSSAEDYLQIGNGSEVGLSNQYFILQERMKFWDELYAPLEALDSLLDTSSAIRWIPSLLFTFLPLCFSLSGLH